MFFITTHLMQNLRKYSENFLIHHFVFQLLYISPYSSVGHYGATRQTDDKSYDESIALQVAMKSQDIPSRDIDENV